MTLSAVMAPLPAFKMLSNPIERSTNASVGVHPNPFNNGDRPRLSSLTNPTWATTSSHRANGSLTLLTDLDHLSTKFGLISPVRKINTYNIKVKECQFVAVLKKN